MKKKILKSSNKSIDNDDSNQVSNNTTAQQPKIVCQICFKGDKDKYENPNPIEKCHNCDNDYHPKTCSRVLDNRALCIDCYTSSTRGSGRSLSYQIQQMSKGNWKLDKERKTRSTVIQNISDDESTKKNNSKDYDYVPPININNQFDNYESNDFTFAMSNKLTLTFPSFAPTSFNQTNDDSYINNIYNGFEEEEKNILYKHARYQNFVKYRASMSDIFNVATRHNDNLLEPIIGFIMDGYQEVTVESTRKYLAGQRIQSGLSFENLPVVVLFTGTTTPDIVDIFQKIGHGISYKIAKQLHHLKQPSLSKDSFIPPIASLSFEHCLSLNAAVRALCHQLMSYKSNNDIFNNNSNININHGEFNEDDSQLDIDNQQQQQQSENNNTNSNNRAPNFSELEQWYIENYHLPIIQTRINEFIRQYPDKNQLSSSILNSLTVPRVSPIIIIENFESWNSQIIQDLLYLLNSYRNIIPFVVVFSISTTEDTIYNTLSYETISMLNIKSFSLSPQSQLFEQFVYDVFVKDRLLSFGPNVYKLIYESFKNNHLSVIYTTRQLLYSIHEHFYYNTFSFLCYDDITNLTKEKIVKTNNGFNTFSKPLSSNADTSFLSDDGRDDDDLENKTGFRTKRIDDDNNDNNSDSSEVLSHQMNSSLGFRSEYTGSDSSDRTLYTDDNSDTDNLGYQEWMEYNSNYYNENNQQYRNMIPINSIKLTYDEKRQSALSLADLSEVHLKRIFSSQSVIDDMNRWDQRLKRKVNNKPSDRFYVILIWIENLFAIRFVRQHCLECYHLLLQLFNPSIQYSEILYHFAIKDDTMLIQLRKFLVKEKIDNIIRVVSKWIEILSNLLEHSNYPERYKKFSIIYGEQPNFYNFLRIQKTISKYIEDCKSIIDYLRDAANESATSENVAQLDNINIEDAEDDDMDDQIQGKNSKSWGKQKKRAEQMKRTIHNNKKEATHHEMGLKKLNELLNIFIYDYIDKDINSLPMSEIYHNDRIDKLTQVYNVKHAHEIKKQILNSSEILGCTDTNCCGKKSNGSKYNSKSEDITIMYSLYSEFGRFINLYDWMTSFCMIFNKTGEHTPDLQARFSSALDILQYLGLIQRTNKRTDHVIKIHY